MSLYSNAGSFASFHWSWSTKAYSILGEFVEDSSLDVIYWLVIFGSIRVVSARPLQMDVLLPVVIRLTIDVLSETLQVHPVASNEE